MSMQNFGYIAFHGLLITIICCSFFLSGCGQEGDSQNTTITQIECIATITVDEYHQRSLEGEGLEYVDEPAPGYVTVNQCQDVVVGDQEQESVVVTPELNVNVAGQEDSEA